MQPTHKKIPGGQIATYILSLPRHLPVLHLSPEPWTSSPAITGLYFYFCFPSPMELLKILLGFLPLSICPQPLTAPSLRIGSCPKSNATLLSPHYSLWTLLSELFISKILGQVLAWLLRCSTTPSDRLNLSECVYTLYPFSDCSQWEHFVCYKFFHLSQKPGGLNCQWEFLIIQIGKRKREREKKWMASQKVYKRKRGMWQQFPEFPDTSPTPWWDL